MSTNISTLIYLRTNRPNKSGQLPIYVRFTYRGKRKEFSTKYFIDTSKWDSRASKVKGNNKESSIINNHLDAFKYKANQIILNFTYNNKPFKLDEFFEEFTGKKEKERTLVPIFQNHNQKIKELVGKEYAPGTYVRYETTCAHVKKFLRWKYNKEDIDITKIDHAFINDFDFYLRTVHNCANNTVMKYIKNFKKIVKLCLSNGWIEKDPFINYKTKFIEIERTYLTQEELNAIINKEISFERLDLVRDIFIFSCFTGLAYIDVKQLTKQNLSKDINGSNWIHTHRQKTDTASRIPLLNIPQEILNKYTNHPQTEESNTLLPILSNQRMNAYLKEIADICGIHKILTFHCARHTFATTVTLSNGVPIESVSKMLGHKSIKITQHYAKITDRKVAIDMEILKNKIETNINEIKNTENSK